MFNVQPTGTVFSRRYTDIKQQQQQQQQQQQPQQQQQLLVFTAQQTGTVTSRRYTDIKQQQLQRRRQQQQPRTDSLEDLILDDGDVVSVLRGQPVAIVTGPRLSVRDVAVRNTRHAGQEVRHRLRHGTRQHLTMTSQIRLIRWLRCCGPRAESEVNE